MNDARNVTQKRQDDVDAKVSIEATLEEDTDWRKDDGEDDFDDVAVRMKERSVSTDILPVSSLNHLVV